MISIPQYDSALLFLSFHVMLNLKKCQSFTFSHIDVFVSAATIKRCDGWVAELSLLLWVWYTGENNIQCKSIAYASQSLFLTVNEIDRALV